MHMKSLFSRSHLRICLFSILLAGLMCLGVTVRHYQDKLKNQHYVNIPVDQILLKEKLKGDPPEWMREQIQNDLKAFQDKGISKFSLDTFFRGKKIQDLSVVRFTLSKGHLLFALDERNLDQRQFRHVLAFFKKLNELVPLPDVDFIVSLQDGFEQSLGLECPLFVYAKTKGANDQVLIPDFKALTGYTTLRKMMEKGSQKYPWEKKEAQAFWRGATTGGYLTLSNWTQFARTKLALLSLAHPQELDARFNNFAQCDPEVPKVLKAKGLQGNRVSQINHLKYKYLVDVDGNTCSFERYFWTLLSNSLVLKQETPFIQWYYGGVKPYKHYVPVKEDLSDLLEKLAWARAHDEEARQIAENATAFVKSNLSTEDIFLYMAQLLKEYAKLQRD